MRQSLFPAGPRITPPPDMAATKGADSRTGLPTKPSQRQSKPTATPRLPRPLQNGAFISSAHGYGGEGGREAGGSSYSISLRTRRSVTGAARGTLAHARRHPPREGKKSSRVPDFVERFANEVTGWVVKIKYRALIKGVINLCRVLKNNQFPQEWVS